jgi:hypothetical protein
LPKNLNYFIDTPILILSESKKDFLPGRQKKSHPVQPDGKKNIKKKLTDQVEPAERDQYLRDPDPFFCLIILQQRRNNPV